MYHPRSALVPARTLSEVPPEYEVSDELDLDALRDEYRRHGRVRIYGFLSRGALELYDFLQGSGDWIHLINRDDGVLELDAAAKDRLSGEQWAGIEAAAIVRSRDAFQYRYEAIRVPDAREATEAESPLTAYARFMGSAGVLDRLSLITGSPVASFTDGQATSYGPGDFLTCHDDAVEGKDRLAAYVYGLTPGWRLEWGGLLLFHGEQDRTAEALAPRFNTLDLFSVPRAHSVSLVTGAAPHRRYAVTGWLCGEAGPAVERP